MRSPNRHLLAGCVAGPCSLSACSGSASDAVARVVDAVDEAADPLDETGNVVEGALYVENETEVCHLRVSDCDEPDAAGFDLLAGGERLAPDAMRTFAPGDHPLADDHNLVVTAEACDGTTCEDDHFSFVGHGGAYSVNEPLTAVE